MWKRSSHLAGAMLWCAVAVLAPAQGEAKSHDALAIARAKAKAENQRVLLLLSGGDAAVEGALTSALSNYRQLGKLLRYEYQVAAQPASSLAGRTLRKALGLSDVALPTLAVLTTTDEVVERLGAKGMLSGDSFDPERVKAFLQKHGCEPASARTVLSRGIAEAKGSDRHVLLYLSAPW